MSIGRQTNLRTFVPSQGTGQKARDNSFGNGEAKDSLSGKNSVTEYKTSGSKNNPKSKGGKNTGS